VFLKFTKVLLFPVYLTLKAQAICSSDFQCAAFVLLVIAGDNSLRRANVMPTGNNKAELQRLGYLWYR